MTPSIGLQNPVKSAIIAALSKLAQSSTIRKVNFKQVIQRFGRNLSSVTLSNLCENNELGGFAVLK
jgi:hypothetical protein